MMPMRLAMSRALSTVMLIALIALGGAQAQQPESSSEPPTEDASPDASPQPAPDRGFTPSQEVSPDQEVDFPADI